jgi:hypothetical protein
VFCVWIGGVESEAYLTRRWPWTWFVDVSHVHGVVLEGSVVVVFESAGRELVSDEIDRWSGELSTLVFAEIPGYTRGSPKAHD